MTFSWIIRYFEWKWKEIIIKYPEVDARWSYL